jgi:hypothetical protein
LARLKVSLCVTLATVAKQLVVFAFFLLRSDQNAFFARGKEVERIAQTNESRRNKSGGAEKARAPQQVKKTVSLIFSFFLWYNSR